MMCPFCAHLADKVVDSRESKEGDAVRRRRECLGCGRRFTTYERIDEIPYMVVKKDGRREKFDRQKVLNGLLRACEKRPISMRLLEGLVNDAESMVVESPERECSTATIGERLMERLKQVDKVAYVRFASVYRDFQDEGEFLTELTALIRQKKSNEKTPGPGRGTGLD
jgi:transcriptional repressor NrdR